MLPSVDAVYVLKLDVDSPDGLREEDIKRKAREVGLDVVEVTHRFSMGLNHHYYVRLRNPVSVDMVPWLEAWLGGDLMRSCWIQHRIDRGMFLDVLFTNRFGFGEKPIPPRNREWMIKKMRCLCPSLIEKLKWLGIL